MMLKWRAWFVSLLPKVLLMRSMNLGRRILKGEVRDRMKLKRYVGFVAPLTKVRLMRSTILG